MTIALNVVRFRVKPGREQAFIEAHRRADFAVDGFRGASLIKAHPLLAQSGAMDR